MKQFVFSILWTLLLSTESVKTSFSNNGSKNFSEIVFPKQLNEKLKFESKVSTIIDAKLNAHMHQVSFLMEFNSTKVIVDLNLNKELIPAHFTSSIHSQEGSSKIKLSEKDFHHCHYYGNVRGVIDSHVRVSTCRGLRGYIALKDDYFLIKPLQGDKKGAHILYQSEENVLGSCGTEEFAPIHNNLTTNENNEISQNIRIRNKRDVLSQRLFIELLIVVDANMYKRFQTRESLEEHVKSVVNYIDGYYTELNVRVVLTHLEVWKINKIQFSYNGRTALDQFTTYRIKKLRDDPVDSPWRRADSTHALIGIDFAGITVGVAHLKAMCSIRSAGVNQDLGSPAGVAPILAHELGHNLGMSHDTKYCPCKEDYDCLMAPMVGPRSKKSWTECSKQYLESYLKLGVGNCLMNVPDPKTLYGGPRCGNEIIEKGEECDCGYPDECTSKCCNATTCKLVPEAECDIGDCCSSCKFIAMGTECRKSDSSCDLPEYCTGASPFCPGNVYIEDGINCNNDKDACYDGVCLTRDLQCQIIWGKDSYSGPDICYEEVNKKGNRNGNCGSNDQGTFIKCQQQDATCGKLHCISKTDFPVLQALRYNRMAYANRYPDFECKTIGSYLNTGESQDFDESGLVQEGSRCGKNKSCKNNKCVATSLHCSEKCNGKGVCNNKFNCHCDVGYAPPFCKAQGRGGSIDSGPASQESNFEVILISCLFGLVLPAILFALACIWYTFCKGKDQITEWKKNRKIRKKRVEEYTEEEERLTAVNEMKRMNKVGEEKSFSSSFADSVDSRNNLRIENSNFNQTNQPLKVSTRTPTKPFMKNSPRPSRPPPKAPSPTNVSLPTVSSPQVLTSEFPAPPPYAVSQNFPPLPSAASKPRSSQNTNLYVSQPPPPLPPVATKPKSFHNSYLQGSQTPPLLPSSLEKPYHVQMRKAVSKPSTPIRRTPIKPLKPGNESSEQSLEDNSTAFSVSELKQRFNML